MTHIQELIETANTLSERLEMAAANETKFGYELQLRFKQMAWDSLRLANELKEIKNYI